MNIEDLHSLLEPAGQQLLASLRPYDETTDDPLALASKLRQNHPAPLVAAALTQARLRARARPKLGAEADRMYFTQQGLEQATRASVAAHRANRFAGHARVADLCCGIGGDLVALARAGCDTERTGTVVGVDADGLTAEVAAANLAALGLTDRAEVRHAPAESVDTGTYAAVFCDPGRRSGQRRVFDPAAYVPPLASAIELVGRARGGCLKVAPGIPHEMVPRGAEAEWVSAGGEVKEAALWMGELAGQGAAASTTRRRATLLPSGATMVPEPGLGEPPVYVPLRYLYEPDGAVIRAGLVGEVAALTGGGLLDPTIAYVTSEHLVATPFATTYEVTEALPFSLKRLRTLLRSNGVGKLTIKKRGLGVDVERLRRDLRLSGDATATVALTRIGGAPTALFIERLSQHD